MNRVEANQLLDKVRDGHRYTFEQISAALYASGDLYDPMQSAEMATALPDQGEFIGQSESAKLVVSSENRHCADSSKRQPLTDKQILADETLRYYFGQNGGAGPVSKQGRKIVNAIEAAHGIKEKNK